MTTNAEKTYIINRQLLADLSYSLMELVHRDEAPSVVVDLRGHQPVSQVIRGSRSRHRLRGPNSATTSERYIRPRHTPN